MKRYWNMRHICDLKVDVAMKFSYKRETMEHNPSVSFLSAIIVHAASTVNCSC